MIRHDINDDEIRIISSKNAPEEPRNKPKPTKRRGLYIALGIACVLVALAIALFIKYEPEETIEPAPQEEHTAYCLKESIPVIDERKASVITHDTVSGDVRLTIIEPHDAKASLSVGLDAVEDSAAILMVQAADVRADNGEIAGAFVERGQLISKGQPKSGFCAIIGGTPIIGVATTTPYLEEALDTEGYFFRQYPLVVAGQVVENKPKGRALRKALAEIDGKTVVILSKDRLTFHDFSQSLADLGVNNAIYLIGGLGYCRIRTNDGETIEFGKIVPNASEYINFMVWK